MRSGAVRMFTMSPSGLLACYPGAVGHPAERPVAPKSDKIGALNQCTDTDKILKCELHLHHHLFSNDADGANAAFSGVVTIVEHGQYESLNSRGMFQTGIHGPVIETWLTRSGWFVSSEFDVKYLRRRRHARAMIDSVKYKTHSIIYFSRNDSRQ